MKETNDLVSGDHSASRVLAPSIAGARYVDMFEVIMRDKGYSHGM